MKKIVFIHFLLVASFTSIAQLTGTTTPTGPVLNAAGQNVGTTGCIFSPGGASSCPRICKNSFLIATPNPNSPNEKLIRFNFYNPTNGNKNIRIIIRCGTTLLVDQCMDVSGNDNLRFYKDYLVTCADIAQLTVILTPFTGNDCGGSACGPTEGSIGGAPLPVDMQAFTANRSRSNVLLKWETTAEQHNSGFAIERKATGDWEQVGFVPSQAPNGNSTDLLAYQYTDVNTIRGISQYRIRQVDIDGQSKYTQIIAVKGEGQTGKTIIYPNPSSNGKVNIVFESADVSRDAQLVDMTGRVIKQWRGITTNTIQVDNLTPGVYSLRILVPETGEQTIEKIVVNKR